GLPARLPIRPPRALGSLGAPEDEYVDHAAPADLGRRLRVAGRGPETWVRLLVWSRPDVHVPMGEVLAFPGVRTLLVRQRLGDEIDGFPVSLDVVDWVGVVGCHFAAARFHEADLQTSARDDVRRRVLFRDPNGILPERDQGAEAQDAGLPHLAGEDA